MLGIDCANGATTPVAAGLFESLGMRTVVIGDRPDGRNINLDCGSLHPERLARAVVSEGCQMGVAFDGDGDRAIFVDHTGRVVNGDAVLLMCGRQLQREGRLQGDAIVATVMSNIGLEMALRASGIGMVRCAVGDKYVMEEMQNRGLSLGGEQSGHIIFSDYLFTGDGLCTALNVLRTVALTGANARRSRVRFDELPASAPERAGARESRSVIGAGGRARRCRSVESRLDGQGRLLVRYSGTEPLLRVMLEGKDEARFAPGLSTSWTSSRCIWAETWSGAEVERCTCEPAAFATLHLFSSDNDSPERQRQQDRHAAQLARGAHAERASRRSMSCIDAGAPGITVHPRADRRHITPDDVRDIARALAAPRPRSSSTSKAIRDRS